MRLRLSRGAVTLALALSFVTVTAAAASAAPAVSEAVGVAACPGPGTRVKEAGNPAIYLVDPNWRLRWIPNETVYYNLWETMDGIRTIDIGQCFSSFTNLNHAFLVKPSTSAHTYIYDSDYGMYRWITSSSVFNKYAFSVRKIHTWPSVSPIAYDKPWNF